MRRLGAVIVMLVLLAGCGSADTQETAAPPSTGAEPADSGGRPPDAASQTAQQPAAGPFDAVPAVGGGQVDGAELAGRDLALWFWAPW